MAVHLLWPCYGVRASQRSNGRILLIGTDTSGRVFAEETQTVTSAGHGAGVISTPNNFHYGALYVSTKHHPNS